MADQTTKFRLEQLETRFTTLGNRLHDIANIARACELRLDALPSQDLEVRMRQLETWANEQKGKEMQNRLIMGAIAAIVSIIGAGIVELMVKHI